MFQMCFKNQLLKTGYDLEGFEGQVRLGQLGYWVAFSGKGTAGISPAGVMQSYLGGGGSSVLAKHFKVNNFTNFKVFSCTFSLLKFFRVT